MIHDDKQRTPKQTNSNDPKKFLVHLVASAKPFTPSPMLPFILTARDICSLFDMLPKAQNSTNIQLNLFATNNLLLKMRAKCFGVTCKQLGRLWQRCEHGLDVAAIPETVARNRNILKVLLINVLKVPAQG